MDTEFPFVREKMAEAILQFARNLNNGVLGRTKLFKLLYYLDFDHFERTGEPVTGETYLKLQYGPFPTHGNAVLDQLVGSEALRVAAVISGPYLQYTYQPLREPDLRVFSPEEVKTLADVMAKWDKHNASEIVAATHGEAPWIATEPGQPISYSLAYYRNKFGEMDEFAEEDATRVAKLSDVG